MLNSVNLNDKTYEELLAEAIAHIPLYSREWTNFNVSDPGVTLLQNLTAFQLVQQESINDVPERVRRKLLKLLGCVGRENRAARALIQAPPQGGPILPEGHLLWSGEIPFETVEETPLSAWGLSRVLALKKDRRRDLTRLLEAGSEAFPFGRSPEPGDALVCVFSGTPEMGVPVRLWFQVSEEELRTPFSSELEVPAFAKVRWQYYTALGWADAAAEDETCGFLRSGQVTLTLNGELPASWEDEGCAFRCLLEEAEYDRAPRLCSLAAHLFLMEQRLTSVRCFHGPGPELELKGRLPMLGNLLAFRREAPEAPYRPCGDFQVEETPWSLRLRFAMEPSEDLEALRVLCYDGEMVHQRLLGPVYGYDGQVVPLGLAKNVLPESVLLAVEDEEGVSFVPPETAGPKGFSYHVRSQTGEAVIDDPGEGGQTLLLAGCAVTQGARGNLRSRAVLEQRGGYDGTEVESTWLCPAPARGGVTRESMEELQRRFSRELLETTSAVRAADYETLVRQTPGLCVHKVRASVLEGKNRVQIAVKPYAEGERPRLSQAYIHQIAAFLEPRRMLTTQIQIRQPRYVPVSVTASLTVRGMEDEARRQAEAFLRQELDYVNGPQNFGGWVRLNELYQKLSGLPFVGMVETLSLFPEGQGGILLGGDVRLEDDALCCPGEIRLTVRRNERRRFHHG